MADEQKRVWVIGGGITGLTAAHELAERGFKVFVVESDEDVKRPGEPALGGMAKTQWGYLPRYREHTMQATIRPIHPIRFVNTETQPLDADKNRLKRFAREVGDFGIKVTGVYSASNNERLASERVNEIVNILQEYGLKPDKIDSQVQYAPDDGESVRLEVDSSVATFAPGEHGFRFFHGFYRHVFDTMRRTPIVSSADDGYEFHPRSVFDNLSPSDAFGLDFPPGNGMPARTVEFPRRRLTGLRELFDVLQGFMRGAGHSSEDIGRISESIFKYMTSCSQRREDEYEEMSWWDFIRGPTFDDPAGRHYRDAPRVLVGLTAEHCDARTQGNVIAQMLMDVLFKGERSDATLNGPTTGAWFEHWREYLRLQDVEFKLAKLDGFRKDDDGGILPKFDKEFNKKPLSQDYFVLAVSLPALIGDGTLAGPGAEGLVDKFLRTLGEPNWTEAPDFVALRRFGQAVGNGWNDGNRIKADQSALRHMNGIQFFFPVDVPQKTGRSLYLDSEWQLSSLSQVSFWQRPRFGPDGYRGVLSIDIGAWDVPSQHASNQTAWASNRDTIATAVWEQIKSTIVDRPRWYDIKPPWYHIDDHIEFREDGSGTVERNDAPYLVSRAGQWKLRPGRMPEHPADNGGYAMQCKRWVLAGTFMKTSTRLTSMESANESARHAVNGILNDDDKKKEKYPRCRVWDPELEELPDLEWFRELDHKLYMYPHDVGHAPKHAGKYEKNKKGQRLPHFLDILALDDVTDWLRLLDSGISTERMLRDLITRATEMGWKR